MMIWICPLVVLFASSLLIFAEGLIDLSSESSPAWLPMEHAFSNSPGSSKGGKAMTWDHFQRLRQHDEIRKSWLRSKSQNLKVNGADAGEAVVEVSSGANLPLEGNVEKFGLYLVTIGLGTPSKKFKVQIDTGSGLFWVNCEPCLMCPNASEIVTLNAPFQPSNSSTYQEVSCNTNVCFDVQYPWSLLGNGCTLSNSNECIYNYEYGDYSETTGKLSSDKIHFPALNGASITATVLFGCSYNQTRSLSAYASAIDGLMGLGPSSYSVPSVLSNESVLSNTFSHCLGGEELGGGSLILGVQPYLGNNPLSTPMVDPYIGLYFVAVTGVSVGGIALPGVNSSTFGSPEGNLGTIFDSGTTLAYVPDVVYNEMEKKLAALVNLGKLNLSEIGYTYCWSYPESTSVNLPKYFPNASIQFDGGASMNIYPENYILLTTSPEGHQAACYGWLPNYTQLPSIFGDIILRNKLVTYDNEHSVLKWIDYNCSNPIAAISPPPSHKLPPPPSHKVSPPPSHKSPPPSHKPPPPSHKVPHPPPPSPSVCGAVFKKYRKVTNSDAVSKSRTTVKVTHNISQDCVGACTKTTSCLGFVYSGNACQLFVGSNALKSAVGLTVYLKC